MSRILITFEADIPDAASRVIDWDWKSLIDIEDDTDIVDWSTLSIEQLDDNEPNFLEIFYPYEGEGYHV